MKRIYSFQEMQIDRKSSGHSQLGVILKYSSKLSEKKQPGKAISDFLLHQYNAPSNASAETRLELSLSELETVPHAPCSNDLAPMDFAVFSEIKSQLRGNQILV